nr:FGGY-family carbohydrate kinase [Candidatus Sigynarchaeum springense]MDO8115894.1 FGGY-family carbohydrate kinase [Candidatus Sigynarchaeota archaeon]
MPEAKYILCIDHGTSGVKTAIVSTDGRVIDWAFKAVKLFLGEDGKAEQDPAEWWDAIVHTTHKLIDNGNIPVEDIVGISNSSQFSGMVAIDKDGNHLMNAFNAMDSRGAYLMERFHQGLIKVSGYNLPKVLDWIRITGGGPTLSGKDPIAHLLFVKDKFPEIYNKTYKFLEPQDYINVKLTGEIAATPASMQLFWITDTRDINNVHYETRLIKALRVDPDKFPPLKRSTDVLGLLTKENADILGLGRQTKVVVGAPDLHTAGIGAGAINIYDGYLYAGTSDYIGCHVPYKKTDMFHNLASLPSALPGRYYLYNEQECAGACLSFLRDKVLYSKDELSREEPAPDVYKVFDKIVEGVKPGSRNMIFTPWLYGERAPVDNHSIRGGLYNMSLAMDRGDLIRAIFEGVAYNARWLLHYVEKFIGRNMPALNVIGGCAQSDVWCQIFADVMDRTIRQVSNPIQSNARGAAFIAAMGLGYIKEEDINKCTTFSRVFQPNPEHRAVYDKLYHEFLKIYKAMAKLYRDMNKNS